jgi:head-tail adaptor
MKNQGGYIDIVFTSYEKDSEGFSVSTDTVLASVRAYKEERHGSEKWANRAAFSSASALFIFRKIPGLKVNTSHFIISEGERYNIVSVEDIKGRGMYIEVLAEKAAVASDGKG